MLSDANFLLLDEPTNNLEIPSAEVLEESLDDFEGTLLIISHDRYLLDRVVDRIVELDAGALTEYIGGYSDYQEAKESGAKLLQKIIAEPHQRKSNKKELILVEVPIEVLSPIAKVAPLFILK